MRPCPPPDVSTGDNAATGIRCGSPAGVPSHTRVQLALNVEDLATPTAFYARLFGVPPHKKRDGYANFAVEDPPLKLVLIENPGADQRLNHLGVEAATPEEVTGALARFEAAGLEATVAEQDDNPANPDGQTTSACAVACERGGTCCG